MQRVLITGGSGGIGKSLIDLYVQKGWDVISPTRDELDLSNNKSVDEWLRNNLKPFNAVVVNAGINFPKLVTELENDVVHRILDVNFTANIKILKEIVSNKISEEYLRIVFISSTYSEKSRSGRSIYSASKSAMEAFVNTLAIENARNKVLANSVRPGFIETKLTFLNNDKNQIQKIIQEIPMGRLGLPDEIANLCFFLTSTKNTYITGTNIAIDGGFGAI